MKHWERRRRGVFIPPVLILLLALAAALPAGYLLLRSAGSGPAGMEFARTAASLGHQVTIYEENIRMGGKLGPASAPPGKALLAAAPTW